VWLRAPVWITGKRRLIVAGVIVAAALGTLASAGVDAHRVDAAAAQPPANTQVGGGASGSSSSASSGFPPFSTLPSASSPVGLPSSKPGTPRSTTQQLPTGALAPQLAVDGIPAVALDAYRKAAAKVAVTTPGCGLPWPLLAAIGRVESDHGRFADSQLYADGTSAPRVIGIPLNGVGTALIRDTDHGLLDGDLVYDRAVGPMQFIPSTWANWGVDGNADGVVSPFNIYDAALAAANYLCAAGGNLRTADGQIRAVLTYNDSDAYLATVLALEKIYARGAPGVTIPILPSLPRPKPGVKPALPPADPGTPRALQPLLNPPGSHAPGSSPPGSTPPGSTPGTTPGGSPSGGLTPGGSPSGGSTAGGSPSGGSTPGGSPSGGSTTGGSSPGGTSSSGSTPTSPPDSGGSAPSTPSSPPSPPTSSSTSPTCPTPTDTTTPTDTPSPSPTPTTCPPTSTPSVLSDSAAASP
jgi:membrane-bound lytic murein transglycosylase B